jgi:hypothetical protein
MSRAFRLSAKKLEESGALKYEIREGKPSELRLYNLRKFFRKFAIQMGFEVVEYMMGHMVKGVDGNYRPQDPEYYRDLYSEKAMPFLRLETSSPLETEQAITELERENRKLRAQIETLQGTMEKIHEKVFREKIEDQTLEKAQENWEKEHPHDAEKFERMIEREEKYLAEHPEERKKREEEDKKQEAEFEKYLKENPEDIAEQEKWIEEEAIRMDERSKTLRELQEIIKRAKETR